MIHNIESLKHKIKKILESKVIYKGLNKFCQGNKFENKDIIDLGDLYVEGDIFAENPIKSIQN